MPHHDYTNSFGGIAFFAQDGCVTVTSRSGFAPYTHRTVRVQHSGLSPRETPTNRSFLHDFVRVSLEKCHCYFATFIVCCSFLFLRLLCADFARRRQCVLRLILELFLSSHAQNSLWPSFLVIFFRTLTMMAALDADDRHSATIHPKNGQQSPLQHTHRKHCCVRSDSCRQIRVVV